MRGPEPAEVVEPEVRLAQGFRVDRVEAARALGTHAGETVLAEDLQVLRHGRLGNAELRLHDRGDLPGGSLALGEQLQDPAPDRVAENVEGMHVTQGTALPYISIC